MTDVLEWHSFDYEDKANTAPPEKLHDEMLWIVEDFYAQGVTLGYFDGFTFCTSNGSDDCSVSWWAEITYPEEPEAWRVAELERVERVAALNDDLDDDDE